MKRKNDSTNVEEEQIRGGHSTGSTDFFQSWSNQHCLPHHTDLFGRTESLETDLCDRGIKAIQ